MNYVLQLAAAFSGSMGFALLFQVRRGKLLLASLGGLLAWAVYLALRPVMPQDVPRFFVASVVLTITHTEPGLQGNRSNAGTKPATVETGAEIQVPLFIGEGEKVKVDTRDGSYLGRENN